MGADQERRKKTYLADKEFGRHVKSCRRARGLTQEALAERAELSADTIRRLEAGTFSPSLGTLRKLAAGLGMRLSTLFEAFESGDRQVRRELWDLLDRLVGDEEELLLREHRVAVEDKHLRVGKETIDRVQDPRIAFLVHSPPGLRMTPPSSTNRVAKPIISSTSSSLRPRARGSATYLGCGSGPSLGWPWPCRRSVRRYLRASLADQVVAGALATVRQTSRSCSNALC